jgi:predicted secreted protein
MRIFILSFVFIVFSNCSLPQITKESPQINSVKLHSKFCVILPEDHSTGYLWQLNSDYDKHLISSINQVWHGNKKGIYFNFEALSAGQNTLTFISRKYTDTSDIKRFIVKIDDK